MDSIKTIDNEDFQLLYQILKKPHLQVISGFLFLAYNQKITSLVNANEP